MTIFYSYFDSPVEPLLLTSNGRALTGLYFREQRHGRSLGPEWVPDAVAPPLPEARLQLTAFFEGARTAFDLPLAADGTEFQRRVWAELTRIPFAETISYAELARRIGSPRACRAVGLANGRNPISIIVPCHRVIGADGRLTRYGGGLDRKAALLAFERSGRWDGGRAVL